MNARTRAILAVIGLICMMPAAGYAITAYSQNFEGLAQTDPDALGNDGWVIYGNVFTAEGLYLYGYGTFPAPNHALAFSQIDTLQGGDAQGTKQLAIFNDYENLDHEVGNLIESNVFQEQTIGASDIGSTWIFSFEAKYNNLEGSSTAAAYIKTLDPGAGYATTNLITADMTEIPETWGYYSINITLDASLEGQLIQFGFTNTAANYEGSGVFYDNIDFDQTPSAVRGSPSLANATMRQNYPNPFNPSTRIDFSLETAGRVDISIFDLAGRRIATILNGDRGTGEHHVTWNGKTDGGLPAPAGQYRYVLKTASGQLSNSMLLVK